MKRLLSKRDELKPNTVITLMFLLIDVSCKKLYYDILSAHIFIDCSNNHSIHCGMKSCESLNEKFFVVKPLTLFTHDATDNGINREFIIVDSEIDLFIDCSIASKSKVI
ncbi:hypothetical protein M9Y10_001788 [Tritrichomonas musculus]|uniref:Uncharacterized protein n=1 Tax=Tritrichomonas musculus TaxID=1915356 RepID=A0ABR2L8C2_9EUKA